MRETSIGLYSRFGFIDEIVEVDSFAEILDDMFRKRPAKQSRVDSSWHFDIPDGK